MPYIQILVKPVSGSCNLDCRYCFYKDETKNRERASYGKMSESTLEALIRKTLETAEGGCTIAYQGGEPTLAGLDFFKKAAALQKKYNQKHLKISNAIQTNGIGLDPEWAEFFVREHYLVGLSLDGTRETHDRFRVDYDGKGSFARVMDTVALFKKHGVEFNILTVINAVTARKIESIMNFYDKEGLEFLQFIPCLDPIGGQPGSEPYSLSPKQYAAFLKRLFDIWYRKITEGKSLSIRQFENYVQMLLGYPPESCGMAGVCAQQNVVEADGSVYPCDFYVLDGYRLGNINTDGFEALSRRCRELRFIENSAETHEKCLSCKFFALCRGGCKRYRTPLEQGGFDINLYCPAYYDFFSHSYERLVSLANRMKGLGY